MDPSPGTASAPPDRDCIPKTGYAAALLPRSARLAALPLLTVAGPASAAKEEWPIGGTWQPLPHAGAPTVDPAGDVSEASLDLIGDEDTPAVGWSFGSEILFLRQRLAASPLAEDGSIPIGQRAWILDLDDDPETFEWIVSVQGDVFSLDMNLDGEAGRAATAEVAAGTIPLGDCEICRFESADETVDPDDVWFELALYAEGIGLSSTSGFRVLAATGTGPGTPDADFTSGDESAEPAVLTARWSDRLTIDGDEDGLDTPRELAYGTDPTNPDSDGGGRVDGAEDADGDGVVGPWETDPLDGADDVDSDSDDIPDLLEARCGALGDDGDADGIADGDEGLVDTDGDGQPDFCDIDDDQDGIRTVSEGSGDTDDDGVPDHLDRDADNDGLTDDLDGVADLDCDTLRAFQDPDETDGDCADPDGDGLDNRAEAACGSDPHGADSDGDGLDDVIESCATDEDCDQLPDRIDGTFDTGWCGRAPDPGPDTACVDADPTDAWEDCPGVIGGGGGCATVGPRHAGLFASMLASALAAGTVRRRRVIL